MTVGLFLFWVHNPRPHLLITVVSGDALIVFCCCLFFQTGLHSEHSLGLEPFHLTFTVILWVKNLNNLQFFITVQKSGTLFLDQ